MWGLVLVSFVLELALRGAVHGVGLGPQFHLRFGAVLRGLRRPVGPFWGRPEVVLGVGGRLGVAKPVFARLGARSAHTHTASARGARTRATRPQT